ncbi:MAG: acetyl-CoA carboxylase carboxyltransferase subunit alpha [Alphaproteobacteria bacterium]|nr:acetyl-CoA carboxylase carboxyltransferase subunit alpha [Alphaproteobacteria bacterium]MCL2505874.1 acetyl-CoA carboxylase carboxyltransferase subunit alpha [Alphaproteobacteria bacterium]
MQSLDFEQPVVELETKIDELRHLSDGGRVNIGAEISKLQTKVNKLLTSLYDKLSPSQKVMVARHPDRPHCTHYIKALIEDFTPLAGDRLFGEDLAVIGGIGMFRGFPCVVIGQEKGFDTQSRIKHNFGMAKPEGYRKAQRLMHLAEKFRLPIITLVDTAGAFPGVDAEARGQAQAIARSIEVCLNVKTPLISCIIGEGGSGGAIALAAADRILMLEHSIYSVISPEGCASILWRNAANAPEAAQALKLTAQDLQKLGIIDEIIKEPIGGAQRDPKQAMEAVGDALEKALKELSAVDKQKIVAKRRKKFLAMGKKGFD